MEKRDALILAWAIVVVMVFFYANYFSDPKYLKALAGLVSSLRGA